MFPLMCFACHLNFELFAISRAPELSSKTLHLTFAVDDWSGHPFTFISLSNSIVGVVSLRAHNTPTHSMAMHVQFAVGASKAVSPHHACLDLAVSGSLHSFWSQFPMESGSTCTSSLLPLTGFTMVPMFRMPFKCLTSHQMASPCSFFRASCKPSALVCYVCYVTPCRLL